MGIYDGDSAAILRHSYDQNPFLFLALSYFLLYEADSDAILPLITPYNADSDAILPLMLLYEAESGSILYNFLQAKADHIANLPFQSLVFTMNPRLKCCSANLMPSLLLQLPLCCFRYPFYDSFYC